LVCKRLEDIGRWKIVRELEKFPSGLQPLYERMMQQIEDRDQDGRELCKQILWATVVSYRPLTLEELLPIAGLPEEVAGDVSELVKLCDPPRENCLFCPSIRKGLPQ
jgi:hypothetical protein